MSSTGPAPSGARFVAIGILVSKIFGVVREVMIARFFGVGLHGDVYRNAMRAPNVLQNLLGEQTLSAAFIPVYSRFLAEGRREEAGRFAGAVFCLLVVAVTVIVGLGILLAPWIVSVLAAGFLDDAAQVAAGELSVDRFPLTVQAVRIVFPMSGFMVLAAWALGILNSHRRFVLPYLTPLFWNCAIITALVWAAHGSGFLETPELAGNEVLDRWLFATLTGALVGGVLQFAVQIPFVWRTAPPIRFSLSTRVEGVREALQALGPALAGRGVVQLSFYLNLFLANFLKGGAPSAIGFAGTLYNLPMSAFGLSIAAAELPELSRLDPEKAGKEIRTRIDRALRQSAFVVCPAVVGFLVFGVLAAAVIYRRGSFTDEDLYLVYTVLVGYSLGLLASTLSRLLQNSFFALRDTRTPARIAAYRLALEGSIGIPLMVALDRISVAEVFSLVAAPKALHLGAVGLSLASSAGAWCELWFLRRELASRIPGLTLPWVVILRRLATATLASAPALALWWMLLGRGWLWQGLLVLPTYIATYLAWAWWTRQPELALWLGRLGRRR